MTAKQNTGNIREYEKLTSEELRQLAEGARKGEEKAIEKLCEAFAPLVYREARAENIYNALGEDAVNTAWELFLELVQKEGVKITPSYPGFLKKSLHLGLLKKALRRSGQQQMEVADEALCLHTADKRRCEFEDAELRLVLHEALGKLTEKQRSVVWAAAVEEQSFSQVAEKKHINIASACKLYKKGLHNLRNSLQ